MIAVINPKELACCRCEYAIKRKGWNGWICSLTNEIGYPHYADAFDRFDNCPLSKRLELRSANMKLITREDCEHLKARFEAYTDIAGQHEFARLMAIDVMLKKTWKDLDNQLKNNQKDLRAMFRVILTLTGAPETAKEYIEED